MQAVNPHGAYVMVQPPDGGIACRGFVLKSEAQRHLSQGVFVIHGLVSVIMDFWGNDASVDMVAANEVYHRSCDEQRTF